MKAKHNDVLAEVVPAWLGRLVSNCVAIIASGVPRALLNNYIDVLFAVNKHFVELFGGLLLDALLQVRVCLCVCVRACVCVCVCVCVCAWRFHVESHTGVWAVSAPQESVPINEQDAQNVVQTISRQRKCITDRHTDMHRHTHIRTDTAPAVFLALLTLVVLPPAPFPLSRCPQAIVSEDDTGFRPAMQRSPR